ncbi:MAG: rhodanese-like domain-containing protein [Spirochaetes bacterium]|nr:rhodanese-like domain-containing protein [Spirochaetota bacterium]MBU0955179.1 rhodanese-like domain-containing protein [Spirochaetota bacterium]
MDQQNLLLLAIGGFSVYLVLTRVLGKASVKTLSQKLTAGATIVDVRSPGEFSSGHVRGALNLPLDSLGSKMSKLGDKSRPVIVYCASGSRSSAARRMLKAAGFSDVSNAGAMHRMPV